jgi:death-on-curing protein
MKLKKIYTISAEDIIDINRMICVEGGNRFQCYSEGKIESALHSAFYPGTYPFQHGGLARIAGALAFYITQTHAFYDGNKRTALLASVTFLNLNNLDLEYPKPDEGWCELSKVINSVADGTLKIEKLKEWYENHKISFS